MAAMQADDGLRSAKIQLYWSEKIRLIGKEKVAVSEDSRLD
jgi:hypothetical protein